MLGNPCCQVASKRLDCSKLPPDLHLILNMNLSQILNEPHQGSAG